MSLLTDHEILQVVRALEPHYPEGVPGELLDMAIDWVDHSRIGKALADMVINGKVTMQWKNDDWAFSLVAS